MLEIFVEYFRCGDRQLPSLLEKMSSSQIDELVDELEGCIQNDQKFLLSLRFLFHHPKTRVKAFFRSVQLLQLAICDRVANLVLPEMHSAVIECCDQTTVETECTRFVEDVVNVIISPFQDEGALMKDGVKGFAHALEIFPTILECLNLHESVSDSEKASIREYALTLIIDSHWPALLLVPTLKILLEMNLNQAEQSHVYESVMSVSTSIDDTNLIGTIDCALAMAEKYESTRWFDIVRTLVDRTPQSLLSDALCVIEISFQNCPRLVMLLLSSLKRECKPGSHKLESASTSSLSSKLSHQMKSSDFTLLLLAAHNDLYRDSVIQTLLSSILGSLSPPADSVVSSCRAHANLAECKMLLGDVARRSEAASQIGLLLDLAILLLHPNEHVDPGQGADVGEHLVKMLYMCQPHSRSEVLKTMFNALVENTHLPQLQGACARILTTICSRYLISLREHAQVTTCC
jgi:hypothetical protein